MNIIGVQEHLSHFDELGAHFTEQDMYINK